MADETFSVRPATSSARIPPSNVVGMAMMIRKAWEMDPKDVNRMMKMMRITIIMMTSKCFMALCWLSNWPPKVM